MTKRADRDKTTDEPSEADAALRSSLSTAMARKRMNPNQVSKASGVAYATVHGFFNEGKRVTLLTVERMCEALGVELVVRRKGKK